MARRSGVAARSKANEVKAKLAERRRAQDERIAGHVEKYVGAQEVLADLQTKAEAARKIAAAAIQGMRDEDLTAAEIAEFLGLEKNDVTKTLRSTRRSATTTVADDDRPEPQPAADQDTWVEHQPEIGRDRGDDSPAA